MRTIIIYISFMRQLYTIRYCYNHALYTLMYNARPHCSTYALYTLGYNVRYIRWTITLCTYLAAMFDIVGITEATNPQRV